MNALLRVVVMTIVCVGSMGLQNDTTVTPFIPQHSGVVPFVNNGLRCTTWPSHAIGTHITCDSTCSVVCQGIPDCPCNDNGRGVGCWVPISDAKRLCAGLDDCNVISTYHGDPRTALPHYGSWAHLGSLPLVQSQSFSASICDKEIEGCFDCSSSKCESSQQTRLQCYAREYDYRLFDQKNDFCVSGHTFPECVDAVDTGCCEFIPRGKCDVENGTCQVSEPLCSGEIINELLALDFSSACDKWLESVLLRTHPSVESTCACVNAIHTYKGTLQWNRFECSIIPNTHMLTKLHDMCEMKEPCSEIDKCSGCSSYYVKSIGEWTSLESSHHCLYSNERHQCVLVSDHDTLHQFTPCGANNIDTSSADWYWTSPPPPAHNQQQTQQEPTDVATHSVVEPDPMPHRYDPVNSTQIAPSPLSEPSPSPLPALVDFNTIIIGSNISHRHFTDGGKESVYIAITCDHMPSNGVIKEWSIYSAANGTVHVQILRPSKVPESLSRNPDPVTAYRVVGENVLTVPRLGAHTYKIPAGHRIRVEKGDIIGFYSTPQNILSWSEGGDHVFWRYGKPSDPTLAFPMMLQTRKFHSDSILFVGEGTHRTYSISTSLQVNDIDEIVEIMPSPSTSPSSHQSVSPSHSPFPSESPVPSPSSPCTQGPAFWCHSSHRRVMCNISNDMWTKSCVKLNATLPPHIPPRCDTLMRCASGFIPRSVSPDECFDPKVDCLPKVDCHGSACDHWEADNVAKFSACPYCNGGDDWTGLCIKGSHQSPVKIPWTDVNVDSTTMQFFEVNYKPMTVMLKHTGYALMMTGEFGSLNVNGTEYDATSITFHAPAEHQIEGIPRSDVEIQIMHKRKPLSYTTTTSHDAIIISVLFDQGEVSNSIEMSRMLSGHMPTFVNGTARNPLQVLDFDLGKIVSEEKPVMWYEGSLTIPPCTEGIMWGIQMGTNSKLTKNQVGVMNKLFKDNSSFANGRGNNRRLQPTNGRSFELKSNCGATGAIACPRSDLPEQVVDNDSDLFSN